MRFVYLFVCQVQFPAQGAGFCLQFPNVQDKQALYKGAASRNFVLSEPQASLVQNWRRKTAHDRRTNRHFKSFNLQYLADFLKKFSITWKYKSVEFIEHFQITELCFVFHLVINFWYCMLLFLLKLVLTSSL